jgi:hypothetical protein
MKSMMKMEDRILSMAVLACYIFVLAASSVATYAIITLSQAGSGGLGRSFYLTVSQL